jgi:hypothetical protein
LLTCKLNEGVRVLDRNQAVILLQNALVNYSGNSINSFGLTQKHMLDGKIGNYGCFIKEFSTKDTIHQSELFAEQNNFQIKKIGDLIVYESKEDLP